MSVLAKALGRFYAAQVIQLKHQSTKKVSNDSELLTLKQDSSLGTLAYEMSLSIEQIEVTLESYGTEKLEQKKIPRNRTYLMLISRIAMQQRSKGMKQFSRLAINDISIVQMIEVKHGERRMLPGCEPQHQILAKKESVDKKTLDEKIADDAHLLTPEAKPQRHTLRTPKELRLFSTLHETTPESCEEFIRACLFRDGENHLDEVEFDVTDVIIRVTPTSILDLTKASTRLFELIQLTSKEMERKIHARNKIRENPGVCLLFALIYTQLHVIFVRCIQI